jgi:hypothetical protein
MQLGKLVNFKNISREHFLKKGDFVLINVCVWKEISGEFLANDSTLLINNKNKRRPLVILEVKGDSAYYIALSTDKKVDRKINLVFDLSKCKINERCEDFKFKKKAYIFTKEKTLRRKKNTSAVKIKLTADLHKIFYLIDDEETQKRVLRLCGQEIKTCYDVFTFCSNCDKTYMEEISIRVNNG